MNADHRHPNTNELDEARLTAYALGQLHETERAAVEAQLAGLDEATGRRVRRAVEEIRALAGCVREGARQDAAPRPSRALGKAVERRLRQLKDSPAATPGEVASPEPRRRRRRWIAIAVAVCVLLAAVPLYLLVDTSSDGRAGREIALAEPQPASPPPAGGVSIATSAEKDALGVAQTERALSDEAHQLRIEGEAAAGEVRDDVTVVDAELPQAQIVTGPGPNEMREAGQDGRSGMPAQPAPVPAGMGMSGMPGYAEQGSGAPAGAAMAGMGPGPAAGPVPGQGQRHPSYGTAGGAGYFDEYEYGGMDMSEYGAAEVRGGAAYVPGHAYSPYGGEGMMGYGDEDESSNGMMGYGGQGMMGAARPSNESDVLAYSARGKAHSASSAGGNADSGERWTGFSIGFMRGAPLYRRSPLPKRSRREHLGQQTTARTPAPGTEQYDAIVENEFLPAASCPLSTFSIDVDTASYANVRRFINEGRWPPPDAVRVEEMVNYFRYDYVPPDEEAPFSVHMEVAQCPWNAGHRLLRIGLKGRQIERDQRGPSNLVFLLDVSGSMADENKLPLLKQAMRLLAQQLTEDDRVAIVTYSNSASVRLESTCAANPQKILDAIDSLSAGGSTHGSAGIQLAYEEAGQHFVEGGTNRVILATDGDLNVGITEDDELVKLIRRKAKSGVFLTVLGFGTGNLKDSKLEKLADHGNGIYAYVDSLREARKVLLEQISASLVTIAKDVKIQIEFNPGEVAHYRLIGYENRLLAARDFDDDKKDAGEIGAGHTVTALYELVPAGAPPEPGNDGPMLKYQRVQPGPAAELTEAAETGELLTLRLRYKEPDGKRSKLLEFVATDSGKRFGEASPDFQFAAAVASFGMVLRGSPYAGDVTLAAVEEFAVSGIGADPGGYRAEFVDLVRRAQRLPGR
jgi:Ca-activated chloride channel family protein